MIKLTGQIKSLSVKFVNDTFSFDIASNIFTFYLFNLDHNYKIRNNHTNDTGKKP